jgi:anti-anti-sigma factor
VLAATLLVLLRRLGRRSAAPKGTGSPGPARAPEARRGEPFLALADVLPGPHLFYREDGSMLDARIVEEGGALVVILVTRSLDSETAPALRREVGERVRGRALVVLSLEHVGEVDCSGLAALVVLLKRMAPGGELRLAGAKAQARALLAATRLDEIFPVFDDLAAALAPRDPAEAASP